MATTLKADGSRLFRVRKTCLKMLYKRGYVVPREHREMTTDGFIRMFGEEPTRQAMEILAEREDDPADMIYVFFPEEQKKVGVPTIKQYTKKMEESNVHRAIMVVRDDITPFAKAALKELASKFRIEYFKEAELLVDITEHDFVPKHEVLTVAQKKELLNRYRLKETQLPRILSNDPIARYYGLTSRQVVKITRMSETAGRYITYRICMG